MKLFTSVGFRLSLKTIALFILLSGSSCAASAQCGLTVSISGSAATCAGSDTLVLTGASSAVQIVWQYGDSTVTIDSAGGTIDTTYIPTISGSYLAIITAPGGCLDTTTSTVVTVYPAIRDTIITSICQGTGYMIGTISCTTSGTYIDTLTSTVTGCDSIVTLVLTVLPYATDTLTLSICSGESINVGGHVHDTTGTYQDTLINAAVNGCDSIVTTRLTVRPSSVDTITASMCASDSFLFGSQELYSAGTYNDTLYNASVTGCDSIVTLVLSISATVTPSVSISTGHSHTICTGTKITFTAHPTNGGSSPLYQWYVTGVPTGTASTFKDSTLSNGDSVWVVMVSNASCATTDTVRSTVISYVVDTFVTPTVTISSTNTGDTLCDNMMANLLAVGTNGGANPDYQWQLNGVNVGNSNTYIANTILNGDVYQCIITSTAMCVTQVKDTSSTITFTVNPYPAVTVTSSSGTNTVCPSDTLALTASGGVQYVWSTGDTTATIYSTGGTYSVTATNAYGCTAGSVPLTLTPLTAGSDSISQVGDSLVSGLSQFYQWYYDGSIISGAIGPVLVPTHAGQYQAAIIDSFGCIAYSAVVTIWSSGISTIGTTSMQVYPNPNTGTFTLELSDNIPHTVTITDALGRVIVTDEPVTHQRQFELPSLSDGLYYLQVADGKVSHTIQFSVVR